MLSVKALSVTYGHVEAVRGASFEVAKGEWVGLIGANGAGKSSTLNAIMGVVPTAAGRTLFEGEPMTGLPPEVIVRLGLALVPEGRQVFQRLTVEENLRVGASTNSDRASVAESIDKAMDRFPILRKYRREPAAQLSGGEQQMLVIARALLCRPRLLLLDEPSLGLAPLIVDQVFEVLAELRDEGVTVLLVEQNAAKTVAAADRVYVMTNGTLREAAESELEQRDLVSAYLGSAPDEDTA